MYHTNSYNGESLSAKTLCLTFDDGPGDQTIEIARFLYEHHIRATFFVVGKYAYHHPDILLHLRQMNHLIGNHTYDHPDLPYYHSVGGDILDQLLRTDAIIKPHIDHDRVYFRAPYGKWSAEVSKQLNQSILTAKHIGPIHWDVAGVDCYYWQNNWSVAEAATRYLTDINRSDHGIIVMHDDIADMDVVKSRNKTLELLKILIPQLQEQGYQFVRLDEIEAIKTVSTEKIKFTLRDQKGKYISLKNQVDLYVDGEPQKPQNILQLEDLGHGKVAIKATNNLYLSSDTIDDAITAIKQEIGVTETFDLIPVDDNGVILRCNNGYYLSTDKTAKLNYKAEYMRQASIFKYASHNLFVKNDVSLKQRYSMLKKQFLFVKSKLQQKV